MFRLPVNTEEVDDYLQYVTEPMDFEKMHMKLDDGEYSCAQDFLDDVDLIAENAISYNCDLAYETNRIICHRARALQDFVYALVKSEMDTDFEDECREIVERRKEATIKLKKIDKEAAKSVLSSPGKLQDMMELQSTACQVCKSRGEEDSMLLCDGCDNGYHTYCVEPPIENVPEGDWFCKDCVNEKQQGGVTPASAESKKGSANTKRRKSRWSSGVLPSKKKKQVKKNLLESDGEDKDEKEKDEATEKDKDNEEEKNEMEVQEKVPEEDPLPGPSHIPDLTPSSPRPSRSSTLPINSNTEDLVAPSVPIGVRIDNNKVIQWSNDLVRMTEGFYVEKLERIYTAMAKVIRLYRTRTDRTDLPTDLLAELEVVKSLERDLDQRQRDSEFTRQRR